MTPKKWLHWILLLWVNIDAHFNTSQKRQYLILLTLLGQQASCRCWPRTWYILPASTSQNRWDFCSNLLTRQAGNQNFLKHFSEGHIWFKWPWWWYFRIQKSGFWLGVELLILMGDKDFAGKKCGNILFPAMKG